MTKQQIKFFDLVEKSLAIDLYKENYQIFKLYPDNTESLCDTMKDIALSNEELGIERTAI